MSELKPCPFCGRTPTVEDCGEHTWFVKCQCGIVQDRLYHQRCDAVRNWNIRFNKPQMVSFREGDKRLYVDPDYLVELYRMVRRDEIVRVIRCKNCRHYMDLGFTTCKYLRVTCNDDDFCSRAERMDDIPTEKVDTPTENTNRPTENTNRPTDEMDEAEK